MSLVRCRALLAVAPRVPLRSYATISSQISSDHDVVIIGGGIAGLALGASLSTNPATSHLKTALVEASDLDKIQAWKPKEDEWTNRISSVTNENRRWLHDIGAWSFVDPKRTCPIEEMQVWDSLSDSRLTLTSPRPEYMSTLVENFNLQHSLLKLIKEKGKNIELLGGRKVESIEAGVAGGWPTLKLQGDRNLRARLIVGADGLRSPARQFAGIPSHGHSYDTHTIVSVMSHHPYPPLPPGYSHTYTAFQRFLPSGPLAFLPLGESRASLAWHIRTPELSKAVKSLEGNGLAELVNACFRLPEHGIEMILQRILEASRKASSAITTSATTTTQAEPFITREEINQLIALVERSSGKVEPHSALSMIHPPSPLGIPPADHHLVPPMITSFQPRMTASFPLAYSHAETYISVSHRVVLVGDAAHTVHPHAGMGLNLGLLDVRALTRTIESALNVGGDLGSSVSLKPYERERWIENQKVLSVTDGLEKVFRVKSPLLKWIRGTGIDILEQLDGVKGLLINQSGGTPSTLTDSRGYPSRPSNPTSSSVVPSLGQFVSDLTKASGGLKQVAELAGGIAGRALRGAVDGALNSRRR
ncbi:Monooxygenase involved in coenzyme Q (ubiquinone) biosynthesis [Phaffia rhodozyma]|uniref:Monooxygenase involved in coenzyme Q (Ubiquinone) biosynthesis n=1 Tax=Phaffia rhodozyma TaxID=264483 RepID=A0A0F7SY52_PHARH|nr:Monooxygenase involved in coenzyme Q (ubiquinone) biosynthesis [Phaffia rhodozyma]